MISNFFLSYPATTRQRHLQMLYLCSAFGDALRVKAAAQHSSSELGSAIALHFTCTVIPDDQCLIFNV